MTATVRDFRTADDIRAARADEAFHDGAMVVITYPTAPPVAYFSYTNPKFFGVQATVGDRVTKDEAGNFHVEPILEVG
jgi:hypothetical protein